MQLLAPRLSALVSLCEKLHKPPKARLLQKAIGFNGTCKPAIHHTMLLGLTVHLHHQYKKQYRSLAAYCSYLNGCRLGRMQLFKHAEI
jgi:hypothetical protein